MKELKKTSRVLLYNFAELSGAGQELLYKAAKVRVNAQAPYSNYQVGVAIISKGGSIHVGCNVERCSWTQTTHAEQNAIDSMVAANGSAKILMLALVAAPAGQSVKLPPKVGHNPITELQDIPVPCGHCLQIIWENCYGDPNVELLALTANGEVAITDMGSALPMRFGPNHLGVDYGKSVNLHTLTAGH